MTRQPLINAEVELIQQEIKSLTKLLISKYDPAHEFEDKLVASCSCFNATLQKLSFQLTHNPALDYQMLLNEKRLQCFIEFAEIMGVSTNFIESQYRDFIQK